MLENSEWRRDVRDANFARDTVWIPSVPLPLLGWLVDTCHCGRRFWFRGRRHRYETHYRRDHHGSLSARHDTLVEVTGQEAKRIHDETWPERAT